MARDWWDYRVKGFMGKEHEAFKKGWANVGDLLVETVHAGEHSKDMEVSVWRTRIARGDASRVEVYDYSTYKLLYIYPEGKTDGSLS